MFNKKEIIITTIIIYVFLIAFSSVFKVMPDNKGENDCKVNIPYDYIVYDRLFCEIDSKKAGE